MVQPRKLEIAAASVPLCGPGDDCAILFARTPNPGKVKSRLWTHLPPVLACTFHCAAVSDTAALLAETLRDAALWVFFSEAPPTGTTGSGVVLPPGFRCTVQEGGDLGDRMAAAFARAFAAGAKRVVIFGSDSPTLPPAMIRRAFDTLADCDLVIGPTEDGGYYLIGCRGFDPQLFHGVEWSTPRTCEQTLANARRLGYRIAPLERWFDLDEWKDVERLLADARQGHPLPSHLAVFFKELDAAGELGRIVGNQ